MNASGVRCAWGPLALLCSLGAALTLPMRAADQPGTGAQTPLTLQPAPYLLLDDRLIERSRGVRRVVQQPKRDLPGPVVTGPEDKCFQPYFTVVRDPQTRRFRMWYGVPESSIQSHLAYIESADGVRWIRPHRVLRDPDTIQFGAKVIDEGPAFAEPAKRFKYGWHHDGGLKVAASADGLDWKMLAPGVVLRHDHDINGIFRDPIRERYIALVSTYTTGDTWKGRRRVTMQSGSSDLVNWEKPRLVVTPDDAKDPGETQFYCLSALLARGGTLVGIVKVLRDDLPADAGGNVAGIGYSTLAWSHDGKTWTRDREPFFDRHPESGTWDHAMSWIDCQLPVGNEVFLYYGGYARGHKIDRFTERQIGLVRIKRDRYVAREAGVIPGTLHTRPLLLDGRGLALNADARGGEIRVQVTDPDGKPLPGFAFADCRPITSDSLSAPVRWARPLNRVRGKTVRLEFRLERARIFAFTVLPNSDAPRE